MKLYKHQLVDAAQALLNAENAEDLMPGNRVTSLTTSFNSDGTVAVRATLRKQGTNGVAYVDTYVFDPLAPKALAWVSLSRVE